MKTAMGITIGVLAAVIMGAALFEIYNVTESAQSKPNPIQVSNYSAQLGSLQPQINSINNNVSSLNSLKGDVSDIKGKLSDLETKLNQAQQQQTVVIANPAITVSRSIYLEGDVVHVSASGLDPQRVIQVQLVDNNGYVVSQEKATTDSSGKLEYDFGLPYYLTPGNFEIKLVSGLMTVSQPISITSYSGSNSGVILSNLSYLFTAQTDRTSYQLGQVIEVSGQGPANTGVTSVLTSPSGVTYTLNTTIQPDATYSIFYNNFQFTETGFWHVTVTNQGQTRVLYIPILAPGGSIPFTFTAQSDRNIYQPGDSIWISGVGMPNTTVNSVLTSPSGATYVVSTTAGSDGTYILSHVTSSDYELGYWHIMVSNEGQSRQISVFLGTFSNSSPFTFTAQTEKSIYTKGETIQVSGTGLPYTTVKTDFTSPSQTTYHVAVSSGPTGSYLVSFPTYPAFETGNWIISVTNWQETKTISIFLQP